MEDCSQGPSNQSDSTFISLLNKTAVNKLKLSYQSSMNITSNKMLEKAWQTNSKLFKKNTLDNILDSAEELLKKSNSNNTQSFASSVSNFSDAVLLFEKSLPKCQKCSYINYTNGIRKIINNKCSCNESLIHSVKSNTDNIKTLHSDNSSQESKSEEIRPLIPKFRPKPKKAINKNLATTSGSVVENEITNQKLNKNNELIDIKPDIIDVDMVDEDKAHKSLVAKITFKTAKEQLLASNPAAKRTLGASRKAQSKFISPMLSAQEKQEVTEAAPVVDGLKHIDPKMIEIIESEILDKGTPIGWDDIAGLQHAKNVIQEAVVWPLLRPDIFTGLRRPPRGVLLFGPPGTGKTLIGKCIAAQCHATFFSISASSLTSKWIGDGEKMVRALFAVAKCHQPAVIFIDEIDSLLSQRSDTEHEATRRIKTEFLVQFDGAATADEDRLLIVGATNRPHDLDEAARRRLVKRLYIPLPELGARRQIITNLLKTENHELSGDEITDIANVAEGYSGADMKCVCSEAAMGPIRSVPLSQIFTIDRDKVRPVNVLDFKTALQRVRPSVSQDDLGQYVKWNNTYGHGL